MAKYVGEFGKRWDQRVPRSQIDWLIARLHVSTSDADIEKDIRARCEAAKGFTEALIKQSVAYAIECHRRNQNLYQDVMRGGPF